MLATFVGARVVSVSPRLIKSCVHKRTSSRVPEESCGRAAHVEIVHKATGSRDAARSTYQLHARIDCALTPPQPSSSVDLLPLGENFLRGVAAGVPVDLLRRCPTALARVAEEQAIVSERA